jgi:DNA-binding transcriptional ArsR family regulator
MVLHAIADPARREIIERLSERPHSVSALAGPLGITVTTVAQYLHVLERARLVCTQKFGRVRSCQIEPGGFAVVELVGAAASLVGAAPRCAGRDARRTRGRSGRGRCVMSL